VSPRRVVFVTGGSRGIGRAVVERFKREGWVTAACATTAEGAGRSGADLSVACDVVDSSAVGHAIDAILSKHGRLDAVVNNAGVAGSNPLDPGSPDDLWNRIIDVNLNGTYHVCKRTLPHLPDGTGRIVNIASSLAFKGVPDQSAYCASKHAVLGLTRALARYVAPRGITVNAVCPGWVRTDMALGRFRELSLAEADLSKNVPLGRFVEPDQVADLVHYLVASEGAVNATGQAYTLDGGALA